MTRLIRAAAEHPYLTVLLTIALSLAAVLALGKIPLDALPDLSDTQVIVFSEWPGRSADLVEDQVTYPLVTALMSSPRVKYVRGLSMSGASQIVVVFDDGVELDWARSRVTEKLATAQGLPAGVVPAPGPEATGLGWVYEYALVDKTGRHDLQQLRTLQEWTLRYALGSVRGVAEVASVGGFVKQYQVLLDPIRLQALGVSPLAVARAVRGGNQEIGASVLEMGGAELAIRAHGYVKTIADIEHIPVSTTTKGRVITVGDVGKVVIGGAARSGAAELDGQGETVGGIVVMRVGENALNVISGVKARLAALKASLPPGVEVVTVYDRSDLIGRAIATLKHVLTEEIIVVALIVSLFLWNARASLVAILPLPIAVLLSFLPMLASGLTVNIMSLGGIALAIGAMVDSGIILVENAHKHLEGKDTRTMPERERRRIITDAMVEMGKPLFYSLLVITVSFLPIFALVDREGRLFKPLAFTKTVSMASAAALAVTLTPALAVIFLRGRFVSEERHPVSRLMHRLYTPTTYWVVRHKWWVVSAALALVLATIPVYLRLPTEFMPPLAEGTILYMPTSVPGMSIDTAVETMQRQDRIIKALPEVDHVFAKAGRANSATDPAPLSMFETVITLKPERDWRPGVTYDQIVAALDKSLQLPGMPNIWWMPIQTRIEMLSTGVRSGLGVKVLADDAATAEATATSVEAALRQVPGTRSAFAERSQDSPTVDIDVRRDVAALYGLNIADVHAVIETVVGGSVVTTVVEGRERYGIQVRYAADFRQDLSALASVQIPTPTGGAVRLGDIATIGVSSGPPMISSENGRVLSLVFVDVDPALGVEDYVARAEAELARSVKLPPGARLEFSGQYEALSRAKATLTYVIPATLVLILLLLYLNTGSLVETAVILAAVPFSLIGAFSLMAILHYKLSVAACVGLLALAGLDAETGVVMLLYLTRAYAARLAAGARADAATLSEAIHEGAVQRVRPKLMTVAAALIGLMPVMWATGTGSEVMKRIAAPMVGGVVTSGLLELLVYPAIFAIWKGWPARRQTP